MTPTCLNYSCIDGRTADLCRTTMSKLHKPELVLNQEKPPSLLCWCAELVCAITERKEVVVIPLKLSFGLPVTFASWKGLEIGSGGGVGTTQGCTGLVAA
jgi:hypothetical protein